MPTSITLFKITQLFSTVSFAVLYSTLVYFVTGSTSGVIASLLSILVASPDINAEPVETNSSYLRLFISLTLVAAIAAFIMYLIIPKIRKLAYI